MKDLSIKNFNLAVRSANRAFLLVLSLQAVYTPLTQASPTEKRASSCEIALAKETPSANTKEQNSSFIIGYKNPSKATEHVYLREVGSQLPGHRNSLDSNIVQSYEKTTDFYEESKNSVRVGLFANNTVENARLTNHGSNPMISQNSGHSPNQLVSTQSNGQLVANSPKFPKDEDTHGVLAYYLQHSNTMAHLSEVAKNQLIQTIKPEAEFFKTALAFVKKLRGTSLTTGHASQSKVLIELSTQGLSRYFKFKPTGSGEYAEARVLDIHRKYKYFDRYGQGHEPLVYILAEWMDSVERQMDGVRVRHIGVLTVAEAESILPLNEIEKTKIDLSFRDFLTPDESLIQNLAENLKIKSFGFNDRTGDSPNTLNQDFDPLAALGQPLHILIRDQTERRFGSLDKLLTTKELNEGHFNILDVMGRHHPRYILEHFESRGDGFKYIWVLTEDGTLKISTHGSQQLYMGPLSYRLAHGRKVRAAGFFTIDDTGQLDLELDSSDYQNPNGMYGNGAFSFRVPGNENLDLFLMAAFHVHLKRPIKTISHRPMRELDHEQNYSFGFNYDGAFEYFKSMMAGRNGSGSSGNETLITWDVKDENAYPLGYVDWLKEMKQKQQDHSSKLEWAHYVLNTNGTMSFGQIKSSYRKLAQRLHPDRVPETHQIRAEAAFKNLQEAYNLITR